MLKKIITALVFTSLATGCFVHSHGRGHGHARRGCGPAYHWEGGRCVHNGRGRHKGHKKDVVIIRDNRR